MCATIVAKRMEEKQKMEDDRKKAESRKKMEEDKKKVGAKPSLGIVPKQQRSHLLHSFQPRRRHPDNHLSSGENPGGKLVKVTIGLGLRW